ncbi:MAG TPA: MerR family transcriptional regulator [Chitinophagales bacterium]|nr:MerR family transcriptional regulator [Chitinophagales bacterium]
MGQYSIKEVEVLTGIKAHTLRIWEQRYNLLKPKRTDTNIRYYSDEQLRLLLNISTLNRNGLKISKIVNLNEQERNRYVLDIYQMANADNLLDSLIHCMLDFDEVLFEKILVQAIMKLGFENAINELVFPFMMRTGILWSTGAVKVAQEHFITNLIRRKILVAIDAQQLKPDSKTKKFVLFLPEGETHELLLLYTEYILRKNNHHVAYLGADLPVAELPYLYGIYKPDYLVTFLTAPLKDTTPAKFLKSLGTSFPNSKVLIGGAQLEDHKTSTPPNCTIVRSHTELLKAISQ